MRRDLIIKALSNPLALAGFIIIMGILVVAILAPYIAPYDPNAIDVKAILLEPSALHYMGTDGLGRDVFSRMLHGARISLLVGIVAVGIATAIGVVLGALAGRLARERIRVLVTDQLALAALSLSAVGFSIDVEREPLRTSAREAADQAVINSRSASCSSAQRSSR